MTEGRPAAASHVRTGTAEQRHHGEQAASTLSNARAISAASPATGLMQRLNPTGSLLRAAPFVARHDYIFTLLCLLNVNMGALNSSALQVGRVQSAREVGEGSGADESVIGETPMDRSLETVLAQGLLDDMAVVFQEVCGSRAQ